jgi:hypothetical protein
LLTFKPNVKYYFSTNSKASFDYPFGTTNATSSTKAVTELYFYLIFFNILFVEAIYKRVESGLP